MNPPRILRFYLDDNLRQSATDGRHNFINKIAEVVETAGYRVEYCRNTPEERLKSAHRRGYSMFHMDDPFHPRALTIRRVYSYPFWTIERSARRWEWRVAVSRFEPDSDRADQADRFFRFWQHKLFGDRPEQATRNGIVYVPLQGKLLTRRSFQTCSPIEMLNHTLAHDPSREIVATLHPNETYSAQERAALDSLARSDTRLSVQTGGMESILAECDYVVTQNSAAAFFGYFFRKPAVLFSKIDFHHIAANAADLGAETALELGPQLQPDYAAYVHWFWQIMSTNAGRDQAADQIRAALVRAGWPM